MQSCTRSFQDCGVAQAAPLPDPHNVSHTLDDEMIAGIITRLESRGKDAVFRSLFGYFDAIKSMPSCQNVLEVGAGTGVIARALQQSGFAGHITAGIL